MEKTLLLGAAGFVWGWKLGRLAVLVVCANEEISLQSNPNWAWDFAAM
jgi:hypothetical protein